MVNQSLDREIERCGESSVKERSEGDEFVFAF